MHSYRVGVTNANVTVGVGPTLIQAESEEDAKMIFAGLEGTTVEALEDNGLSWWNVEKSPDDATPITEPMDTPTTPLTIGSDADEPTA